MQSSIKGSDNQSDRVSRVRLIALIAILSAFLLHTPSPSPAAVYTPGQWSFDTNYNGWNWLYDGKYAWTNDPWSNDQYDAANQFDKQVLQIKSVWQDKTGSTHLRWKTTWNWSSAGDPTGGIKAYPFVGFGSSNCGLYVPPYALPGSDNLPRGMWIANPIPSFWHFQVLDPSNTMDVAYDIWTQDGSEIMVWLYAGGGAGPISLHYPNGKPEVMATTTIDGIRFNFSYGGTGHKVYSFVIAANPLNAERQYQTPRGFDLEPFLTWSMYDMPTKDAEGDTLTRLSSSTYLTIIEAGAEISHGTGGLFTYDYTANVH